MRVISCGAVSNRQSPNSSEDVAMIVPTFQPARVNETLDARRCRISRLAGRCPSSLFNWLSTIAIASAVVLVPFKVKASEPLALGGEAQVLVDDYVVESTHGLVRRINPLTKHPSNPVLRP